MDLDNRNILDVYLFLFSTTNAMVFYLICGTWGKVYPQILWHFWAEVMGDQDSMQEPLCLETG